MFAPADLFDLARTEHAALFDGCRFAWEALAKLESRLAGLKPALRNRCVGAAFIDADVSIGEGTVVEDGVMICGPVIIGRNCHIRHGAYLRDHVIVGDHCVVGHACEIKRAILFDGCQVPHFNYVGDSILGAGAHLGAGVKISNVKLTGDTVTVMEGDGRRLDTGLKKFGALIGDRAEIGCNAVLNPGSVIGRDAVIYPNVNWRGVLPSGHIAKNKAAVEVRART